MKITNFSTMIISPKADEIVEIFNALGFEKEHKKEFETRSTITSTVMKDNDGHIISIAKAPIEADRTVIRMNVDNYEEAYELLQSKGFVNAYGTDKTTDTGSSKAALMISPTGFAISLAQHIKQ